MGWKWWPQTVAMNANSGPRGGLADPFSVLDGPGRSLSLHERVDIQSGLRAGRSQSWIAESLGRDRSVVCREIARNRSPDGVYYAVRAHALAHQRRRRPKAGKLASHPGWCRAIEGWMDDGWSPGLISRALASSRGGVETWRVSHETIYRALYVQTRGALRQDLAKQLSTGRTARKPVGTPRRAPLYPSEFSISERPAEAEDRAVPGHWEGDLILGANGSAIGTLVERSTRFVILLHLPERHTADAVANAMIQRMRELPAFLRRTVTWDRGSELAHHERIRLELDLPVFFADPRSPWQRGTNENTNRLLRHWFKKDTDLREWTAEEIYTVQDKLNVRPRPTLDMRTPRAAMEEFLQQAA